MIIENPIPPYLEWIGTAALNWAISVGALILLSGLIALVFLTIRKGPKQAFPTFFAGIRGAFGDLTQFSWRRTWAIASLAIRESIRKKVVVVCVVFLALLMFAGWFLDPSGKDPARLCASFVYQSTTYLVLLLAIFLSALSLPADFKTKTIYTIVTKPVRSSEIVLGRVLGLTVVGTAILALMAVCSYLFVSNTLSHKHVVVEGEDISKIVEDESTWASLPPETVVAAGETRLANGHKHKIELYADGQARVVEENKHAHSIERVVEGDKVLYKVGDARGALQAKTPIYGKIKFRGENGFEKERGINVGEEWEYRSYVAGATEEAVIWTFEGVTPERFPDGLPVEMTISAFRTHMGNIEATVMGALYVRNPKTGLTAETNVFNSEKYTTKALFVDRVIDHEKNQVRSRSLKKMGEEATFDPVLAASDLKQNGETYDLFEDFVVDGKVEIWLQCLDSQQYFGAAEPDLYLRAQDANVFANFFKGYLGLWQQMVILISFGVLFSAFLSGPVAMAATFGILIAGFSKNFFVEIARLEALGGGPIESFNRLVTHENMMSDLSNTFGTHLIKAFDAVSGVFLSVIGLALPAFSDYNFYADCVANGYDVPWNAVAVHMTTTASFAIPLFVVGYAILRNREVAK